MLPVIKGKKARPRRTVLYGTHGIGKTTWAANAPAPLVLQTEDGCNDIGCDRTPLLKSVQDVSRWLIDLTGEEEHEYKSIIIDTLDWLEKLIWRATCEDAGKKSIEEFGYGKGYVLAISRWEKLLQVLDLCISKGMNVILLAHAKIERFSPPDSDQYDRWQLDLHKTVSPLVQEWADEVLFAKYKVDTIRKDEGFGNSKTKAIGSGERVVYTCEAPTHMAKRRIEMPNEIGLDWNEYHKHWPSNGSATNIAGVVKDGSSKKGQSK